MRVFLFAINVFVVTMVVACQQPPNGETPVGSTAPGGAPSTLGPRSPAGDGSPVAPAIEPSHPDAERTDLLPESLPPIAPDVEIESGPDPTVPTEPG